MQIHVFMLALRLVLVRTYCYLFARDRIMTVDFFINNSRSLSIIQKPFHLHQVCICVLLLACTNFMHVPNDMLLYNGGGRHCLCSWRGSKHPPSSTLTVVFRDLWWLVGILRVFWVWLKCACLTASHLSCIMQWRD